MGSKYLFILVIVVSIFIHINAQFGDNFFGFDDEDISFVEEDEDEKQPEDVHIQPTYEKDEDGNDLPVYDISGGYAKHKKTATIKLKILYSNQFIVESLELIKSLKKSHPEYVVKHHCVQKFSIIMGFISKIFLFSAFVMYFCCGNFLFFCCRLSVERYEKINKWIKYFAAFTFLLGLLPWLFSFEDPIFTISVNGEEVFNYQEELKIPSLFEVVELVKRFK